MELNPDQNPNNPGGGPPGSEMPPMPEAAGEMPEQIAEKNRRMALAVPEEFESYQNSNPMLEHDPLYRFARDVLRLDPENIRVYYAARNGFKESDAGGGGERSATKIYLGSYRATLRMRGALPEDLRKELDAVPEGRWSDGKKISAHLQYAIEKRLNNPDDEFFVHKTAYEALCRKIEAEELPDAYALEVQKVVEKRDAIRESAKNTPEQFEDRTYEEEKIKRDPLTAFMRDTMHLDPREIALSYRVAISTDRQQDKDGKEQLFAKTKEVANYHDYLKARSAIPEAERRQLDAVEWGDVRWRKVAISARTDFWPRLRESGDLQQYAEAFGALCERMKNEDETDAFADAVSRGEFAATPIEPPTEPQEKKGGWLQQLRWLGRKKKSLETLETQEPEKPEEPVKPGEAIPVPPAGDANAPEGGESEESLEEEPLSPEEQVLADRRREYARAQTIFKKSRGAVTKEKNRKKLEEALAQCKDYAPHAGDAAALRSINPQELINAKFPYDTLEQFVERDETTPFLTDEQRDGLRARLAKQKFVETLTKTNPELLSTEAAQGIFDVELAKAEYQHAKAEAVKAHVIALHATLCKEMNLPEDVSAWTDEQKNQLEAQCRLEGFERFVVSEREELQNLSAENWPPKDQALWKKGLNWWMRQGKVTRAAVSSLALTGVGVLFPVTGLAAAGPLASGAWRFARGLGGMTAGQAAGKGIEALWERKVKTEAKKEAALKDLQERFDLEALAHVDEEYGKMMEEYLAEKRKKTLAKAAAMVAMGMGASMGMQMAYNEIFGSGGLQGTGAKKGGSVAQKTTVGEKFSDISKKIGGAKDTVVAGGKDAYMSVKGMVSPPTQADAEAALRVEINRLTPAPEKFIAGQMEVPRDTYPLAETVDTTGAAPKPAEAAAAKPQTETGTKVTEGGKEPAAKPAPADKTPASRAVEAPRKGQSIWKTVERQLAGEFDKRFADLPEAKKPYIEAYKTYVIDAIKDKFVAGGVGKIVIGTDEMDKIFAKAQGLDDVEATNILKNNNLLREWAKAHPGSRLTDARVEEILTHKPVAGGAAAVESTTRPSASAAADAPPSEASSVRTATVEETPAETPIETKPPIEAPAAAEVTPTTEQISVKAGAADTAPGTEAKPSVTEAPQAEKAVPERTLPPEMEKAARMDLEKRSLPEQAKTIRNIQEQILKHPDRPYLRDYLKFFQDEQLHAQGGAGSAIAKLPNLYEQEALLKKIDEFVKHYPKETHFKELSRVLHEHEAHQAAVVQYEDFWRSSKLTGEQFTKIHSTKVGEFLKHYGMKSSLADTLPGEKGLTTQVIAHRRGLAELIEKYYGGKIPSGVRGYTLERLIKSFPIKSR